jgi:pilus assembly protein CpaB
MNRRVLTILLVALMIAGICTFLVLRLVGGRIAASKQVPTVRVVAAVSDVKLGSVLNSTDLTTIEITGSAPKGALLKPEDAIGRGVIAEIYQGEPILESRLASRGSGGGLASTIPEGMRACAVRVDEVVGVAGFVTPGQRVDVVATGLRAGTGGGAIGGIGVPSTGSWTARTILQNIQVLSAGTDIQKDAEGKPHQVQVVNLLVTPDQAETLSLATNQLHIQLVLRNPLDTKITKVHGTAMSSILSDDQAPVAAQPRPVSHGSRPVRTKPYSIEVINGATRTEEKFSPIEAKP